MLSGFLFFCRALSSIRRVLHGSRGFTGPSRGPFCFRRIHVTDTTTPADLLWSDKEIAAALRIPTTKARRLRENGVIPVKELTERRFVTTKQAVIRALQPAE